MTTRWHIVKPGDTLRLIAAQYLGNMARSDEIQRTNGLLSEVIYEGQKLRIETDEPPKEKVSFERLGIVIDGRKLENIPALTIERSIDKMAGEFSFELPNEKVFDDITQPFSYQRVEVYWKEATAFTGTVQRVAPSLQKVALAGYGLPGVLSSCTLPKSLYPRTRYNTSFEQIAKRICKAFAVKFEVKDDAAQLASQQFAKVEIGAEESVGDFLARLAKERGLILYSDEFGWLVAAKEMGSGSLVGEFENPLTLTAAYNGDKMFSDVYGIREQSRTVKYANASVHVADLPTYRHTTVMSRSRHDATMKTLVQAEMQRILYQAMTFSLALPYIENTDGKIWSPGDVVQIVSERHRIYKKTMFMVQSVKIELRNGGESATLTLVPLSTIQGKFRKFWK